jgi:DNA-binding NarL/FixJ family response regulator
MNVAHPNRVLCVDDNELVRDALERKFRGMPEILWCGCLPDVSNLVARAAEARANVVLLDLEMPGPDPLVAPRRLTRSLPQCRVLVLSGTATESLVDRALAGSTPLR